jgi:drug/metabolite transporter (DMT)-like permease
MTPGTAIPSFAPSKEPLILMGLLASLLSAVLSTAKDLVSKRLAFRLDGTLSTYASFAYALPYYLVLLAILWLCGKETFNVSWPFLVLVLLRATTDTLAEAMKMHAFVHGDISLVASFFSLSPLFLLVTSPLITGDPLPLPAAVAMLLVVGGSLLLVYRPSSKGWAEQKKGILLAVGAAVFFSLNTCFDRMTVQKDAMETQRGTPVFAAFSMTLLSAAFLVPVVLWRRNKLAALKEHRTGLWVRGLLEVAFMSCKLYALQYLTGPDVVGIQRISLLLSIVGGHVFFKEEDLGRRFTAGVLILAGVFLIAWLNLATGPGQGR